MRIVQNIFPNATWQSDEARSSVGAQAVPHSPLAPDRAAGCVSPHAGKNARSEIPPNSASVGLKDDENIL